MTLIALIPLSLVVCGLALVTGLPDADEIKNYRPQTVADPDKIDWNNIGSSQIRIWTPIEKISPLLCKAVIISEDDLFYEHNGVNLEMIKDAFRFNFKKKRYARGGSTITMQLARNAFLHKRKTILRKLREIILATRIEKHLTKDQILELYLNVVEWGRNIYGVGAAAKYYFGKSAGELNLTEATLLAGMLPNPKFYNPYKRPESCRRMQARVIQLMKISRMISTDEMFTAQNRLIRLRDGKTLNGVVEPDSLQSLPVFQTKKDSVTALPPRGLSLENNQILSDTLTSQKH